MINDGIRDLEEKIEGMRKAQEAMELLPEIEEARYWGTSCTVCLSIERDHYRRHMFNHLLAKNSWISKQRLDGTYSHFSEDTGSEIIHYTHHKTDIELVLYIEPERETEE